MVFYFPGNEKVSDILNFCLQMLVIAGGYTFIIAIIANNIIRNTSRASSLLGFLVGLFLAVFFASFYAKCFDRIFNVSAEILSVILILGILANTAIAKKIFLMNH